nr:MAG TPA: hypothetical protein [Siphoviridae sp. ctqkP4]
MGIKKAQRMLEHYPLLRGSETLTVSLALQIYRKF